MTGRVHAIVKDLLERGIRNGEFRSCDTAMNANIILAPLGFHEDWRLSREPFGLGEASDDAYFQFISTLSCKDS